MAARRFQGTKSTAGGGRAQGNAGRNASPSHGMQADRILAMQASVGNQATMGMMEQEASGLPDNLRSGMENLSGYSMDDVKVHYNSDKPAQLNAHAYAQGSDIHVASGQEQHTPHEAWHVMQQAQGRVQPTLPDPI
ncbi:hypothetical protein B1A99_04615 [Cohnella sp. CIP 111063]|uniref:eCIS core domain-containing protein n=1 Tax=unclassified Cohnella TaxID=2636738 RepID=UPI000B8C1794|nr:MULTISPECIES: DUF4157 domain-containing protein [unclassified Cohnella]OXS61887.1 hypothetical protein B1A99_04615 [Cohnella sp. CIP 111063]PRX74340.1 uncharacterized protein DUF4157 [Cohnella sp. SGD-V74]